jgi:dephospho-CoA kinase
LSGDAALFIVHITGGIGSGKTAVADRFAALGITIVDADVAAREVVGPGTDAFAAIRARFGDRVVAADGALDRAALRRLVFDAPAERVWLEQLTHPRIGEYIRNALTSATSPYVIHVSPLLAERGHKRGRAQRTLVIDAPEAVQIERTMARDANSEAQVRAIMAAQASRSQRLAIADDVIVNDGDLDALDAVVVNLHERYLELARQHASA